MKKAILWFLALSALAGGGYLAWQKYADQKVFHKPGPATADRKSGPPATAIVATRDISFAVTAAGEIGLRAHQRIFCRCPVAVKPGRTFTSRRAHSSHRSRSAIPRLLFITQSGVFEPSSCAPI